MCITGGGGGGKEREVGGWLRGTEAGLLCWVLISIPDRPAQCQPEGGFIFLGRASQPRLSLFTDAKPKVHAFKTK